MPRPCFAPTSQFAKDRKVIQKIEKFIRKTGKTKNSTNNSGSNPGRAQHKGKVLKNRFCTFVPALKSLIFQDLTLRCSVGKQQ